MNIRKLTFNVLSRIKSTPVNEFIDEFYLNVMEKEKLKKKRINQIFNIAKKNTQFYKEYECFSDLPIISKETLRSQYDDFVVKGINKKDAIVTTTSGSTGKPMTFYLSKNKKYRQNAEVIFYNRWGNMDIGDFHAYVRVTDSKSKLKLFLQNEILINPKKINDEWLNEQVNLLSKKSITGIVGYPSAIAAIASKAIEKNMNKDHFSIKGVITSGETLKEEYKETVKKAFGVNPISRYSTEEFGVLAASCPTCGEFHLNDTGYHIEILDLDIDQPAEVGEEGRVVVTDLFSDNMPLLRFDTGDIAIYGGKSNCPFYSTGEVVKSIVGRRVETVYDINGEAVSGFAVNGALRDFNSIKQFQFVQNDLVDNELLLVINNSYSKEDEELITERFTEVLGQKPKLKIVSEIPALRSGKRPYIVSNYNKTIK